ncbi:MAG: winged helix-turn-helix transcriptional regulator [Rhodobiaceae bacterium]|nr:winged helix-turn-helix transcriptional regulator [Rhodobiaceae bacterium]
MSQAPIQQPEQPDHRLRGETPSVVFVETLSSFGRLLGETYHKRTLLSPNQTAIIAALIAKDGQTQTELAQALHAHKVSVGIYLAELEELTLIERRRHPSDGRAKCAYLTEILKENIHRGRNAMDDVHQIAIAGVSDANYKIMMKCMKQMHSNLEAQRQIDIDTPPMNKFEFEGAE